MDWTVDWTMDWSVDCSGTISLAIGVYQENNYKAAGLGSWPIDCI